MILTLTPNPAIDRTTFVRDFRLGAVVRAEREVVTPSGKGVDASLVIHELGGETVALGLNAGLTGDLLAAMLDRWGIAHDFCAADGETRTATVLVDLSAGEQSTISASSLRATAVHLDRLLATLDRHAGCAWGLICGGSLPPGLPSDGYAHLLCRARDRGLVTLLDTSGDALNGGLMLARSRGGGWPAALAWGTAAAASVVMNDGTAVCHRRQVETLLPQVRVWEFDRAAGQMCETTVDLGCALPRAGEADG